jgi:miniconductance mechanosensitive channel
MTSMKFCDEALLEKLSKIDLIHDYLQARIQAIDEYRRAHSDHYDSPLDGPQITNSEVFRAYIDVYLRNREDIHQEGMPFLVRTLAPNPTGLPIELYIFTRSTQWEKYETAQAEIFDHLLAAASHFELRVFQEPTGLDFSEFARAINRRA